MSGYPAPHRRLRLGMVGGGNTWIAHTHANGARLSNRWEVVAGALSSDPGRAREAGRAWLIDEDRVYTDWREMARAEAARPDGIDAVAIVTPNALHAPVAATFIEAGIDIISDKPLAVSLEEAEALARAHAGTGLFFGVTYAYASHAMVRQAREMVRQGALGALRQVHVEYFQDWAIGLTDEGAEVPWRIDARHGARSFTMADIGTHAAHMVEFVTGERIAALRADFHVTGAPKKLEDTVYAQLRLSGGAPGTLMASQVMAGSDCGLRIRVSGSEATLDWCAETPEVLELRRAGAPVGRITRGHGAGMTGAAERLVRMPRGHPEALTDAWANLYLEFAVAIEARRTGRSLPDGLLACPDIEEGVRGMRFIEAAIRSNAEQGWAEI